MPQTTDIEERIRRLSAGIIETGRGIRKFKDDTGSFLQEVLAVGSMQYRQFECDVTITGTVFAATSIGACSVVPGVSVEIWTPDNTGTMIGSDTTDGSGNYTINGSAPLGAPVTAYFSRLPWWADSTETSTLACGSNTIDHIMHAASGYHVNKICCDPIGGTLTFVDSIHPTPLSMVWGGGVAPFGGGNWWYASQTVGGNFYEYQADFAGNVPLGNPPYVRGIVAAGGATITDSARSFTCGGLNFSGTMTLNNTYWPAGPATFTVTDP